MAGGSFDGVPLEGDRVVERIGGLPDAELLAMLDADPQGCVFAESVRAGGAIVDFRLIHINEAGCRLLARPREELVGHGYRELWPETVHDGTLPSRSRSARSPIRSSRSSAWPTASPAPNRPPPAQPPCKVSPTRWSRPAPRHRCTPRSGVATFAQVLDLAARVPARFRALILRAAFTSLRYGELVALRRTDLGTDLTTVTVWSMLSTLNNGSVVFGPPKSAAGRRTVTIPDAIRADLVLSPTRLRRG
jgi:integrase